MIQLSEAVETLALRVAAARDLPVEDAIRQALEASAAHLEALEPGATRRPPDEVAERLRRMDRIVESIAALPILDPRPVSEIMDDINAV